jgi:predicted ATP-grasp superfamily ATP-dependent carboligase
MRGAAGGHVLIVGASARASAESAARAGFRVTALDGYADLDHHPTVSALALPRDFGTSFSAASAAAAARSVACEVAVYLSPFDNHPGAVATLADGRELWGNPPDVLRRVRNPHTLQHRLAARGIEVAPAHRVRPRAPADLLIKPLASGGGRGVRLWTSGVVPKGWYLQERVDGVPGSVVFVAARGRAVALGVSRQLVGDASFGASGYGYCGSILAVAGDRAFGDDGRLMRGAAALVTAVADEFGVRGVNGIDFVARDGSPVVIEVNARWTASMELVERAAGLSVFDAHASACRDAALPDGPALPPNQVIGKAIVFARHPVVCGDTHAWLGDRDVRDVPRPWERIGVGQPVCTVFAAGPDAARCYENLVSRAERIHALLRDWRQGPPGEPAQHCDTRGT